MFVKYIFWILLFFCSVDAFAKVDWAECSSTRPNKVCYLIVEDVDYGRQIREYQPSGDHLRLTGDRTDYLLTWHADDGEYLSCGSLIQREKHTRYKIDEFCSPKAVGGRRVMMADESDSADVVRLFDALERRRNWLLSLRVGKSNLPICENSCGNPPDRPKAPEVEFSTKEFLREEVKIYRQPDHGCAQTG